METAPSGNILVGVATGLVASYTPSGMQNWTAQVDPTGGDSTASGSNVIAATNGADYVASDSGNLYEINDATGNRQAGGPPGPGAGRVIFTALDGSALPQTPKLASDGTIYIGSKGGDFYHLHVPAVGSTDQATVLNSFTATGTPGTTRCPCSFYGEAALDSAGNAYVASVDTNPGQGPLLGTLYKLDANLNLQWRMPLQGALSGAVLLAPNPATPGQLLVIVADRGFEVAAYDAASGSRVWQFAPQSANDVNPFRASPALSKDGATLYIPDFGGSEFFALQVATGQLSTTFGPNHDGLVPMPQGSGSSPVVDANGNIFIAANSGVLFALAPDGTTLWTLTHSSGALPNVGPGYMSPAIDSSGTLYLAGNSGHLQALNLSAVPHTATPSPTFTATITPGGPTLTPTSTPTVTLTSTNTATSSPTGTATITPTPTTTGTPTSTGTATATGMPTGTNTPTGTTTGTATATQTATSTSTPSTTVTSTRTPTSTSTGTATRTVTATSTWTPTSTGTATALATVLPGPGPGWSSLRADTRNDGNVAVAADPGAGYGLNWSTQISKNRVFYSVPVLSPGGNVVYQIGGDGALYAMNASDGSVKWHSDTVLGSFKTVPGAQADLGSTPAVGADGSIYVGSENGNNGAGSDDGGIYRFNPVDGSNTKFFGSGTYEGSSVVIGKDGTLYAGDVNGTVYAVKHSDGTQLWAVPVQCSSGSPSVQSTGALDPATRILYIGFGCHDITHGNNGGVLAIDSTGNVLWTWATSYKQADGTQTSGGRVHGAVVLSPDSQTLYVTDDAGDIAAIDIASHTAKWVDHYNAVQVPGNLALSPGGDLLYAGINAGDNQTIQSGLVAFHTGDGGIDTQVGPGNGGGTTSSPAIDKNGHVLYAYTTGTLVSYSSELKDTIFKVQNQLDTGTLGEIVGGPSIGLDGTIYVTGKKGTVIALLHKISPTFTPSPTPVPGAGAPPAVVPPTFTPQPTIALGATDTPTPTGGNQTLGGNGSIGTGGNSKQGLGGRGAPGGITTGLGGGAGPSPKPGVTTFKGVGFTLQVAAGALIPGALSQLRVQAKPNDKLTYILRVGYKLTKGGKPLAKAVLDYTSLPSPSHARCSGSVAFTLQKAGTFTLARGVDKAGRDAFCLRVGTVPTNAVALVVTLAVQIHRDTSTSKSSTYTFTLARTLRLVTSQALGSLHTNQIQRVRVKTAPGASVQYSVTYGSQAKAAIKVSHVVGKSGVDTMTFKVAYTPSRADGLVPVVVKVDGVILSLIKGHATAQFQVIRPDVVLALKAIALKVLTPMVQTKATVKVQTISARGAYLQYSVTYAGHRDKVSYAVVADGSGYATLTFPVSYRPAKGKKVPATIAISAQLGRKTVKAVAHFTVQG